MTENQQSHEISVTDRSIDSDNLMAAIVHRRSMGLSRLKPDDVERALIEQMLEAANWAPSNGDTEPWRFTVFTGEGRQTLAELFEAANLEDAARNAQTRLHESAQRESALKRAFAAPVWIAIGMVPGRKADGSLLMSADEEMMAVACAVQNLHLMASALGLAGMWHSKGTSSASGSGAWSGIRIAQPLTRFFHVRLARDGLAHQHAAPA